MKNIYVRRISVLGLCLFSIYIGIVLALTFSTKALWLPIPVITVWLFTYDLVTDKFSVNEDLKNGN